MPLFGDRVKKLLSEKGYIPSDPVIIIPATKFPRSEWDEDPFETMLKAVSEAAKKHKGSDVVLYIPKSQQEIDEKKPCNLVHNVSVMFHLSSGHYVTEAEVLDEPQTARIIFHSNLIPQFLEEGRRSLDAVKARMAGRQAGSTAPRASKKQ